MIVIIDPDNTVQGDYGEVSCDVTGKTYSSVLTVPVVSAGVASSACPQAGEMLMVTCGCLKVCSEAGRGANEAGEGVLQDNGPGAPASSHHDPVL